MFRLHSVGRIAKVYIGRGERVQLYKIYILSLIWIAFEFVNRLAAEAVGDYICSTYALRKPHQLLSFDRFLQQISLKECMLIKTQTSKCHSAVQSSLRLNATQKCILLV